MQCHAEVLRQATLRIKSNLYALAWHSARGNMQGLPELASQGTMPCRQCPPEFVVAFTSLIFYLGSWPENILSEPFHLPRTRKLIFFSVLIGLLALFRDAGLPVVAEDICSNLATFKTAHSDPNKNYCQLKELSNMNPWEYSCTHWAFPSLLSHGKQIVLKLVQENFTFWSDAQWLDVHAQRL